MVYMMKILPPAWFVYAFLKAIGEGFASWGIGDSRLELVYPYLVSATPSLFYSVTVGAVYLLIVKTAPSRTVSVLGWAHLICTAVSAVGGIWYTRLTYKLSLGGASRADAVYHSLIFPAGVQFGASIFAAIFFLIVVFIAYRNVTAPSIKAQNFD